MKVYHDHDKDGNWTRISKIINFPEMRPRLDEIGFCSIIVRDFEGALFAAWEGYNFIPIKVEDDATNIIFRGFLTGKKFSNNQLILTVAGIAIATVWGKFNKNYVLEQGKVKTSPAGDTLTLQDLDGDAFAGWTADYWNSGDQDKGILIVDNSSTTEERVWASSAIAQAGDEVGSRAGNNASVLTKNDADELEMEDDTSPHNCTLDFTMDTGAVISNATFLQWIKIDFHFGMYLEGNGAFAISNGIIKLQIKKDGAWVTLKTFDNWVMDGVAWFRTDAPSILIEDTDAELQKYFTVDGGLDYDALEGLRLIASGTDSGGTCEFWMLCDYMQVTVGYNTLNISPVMKKITDSDNSWIKGNGVADWEASGVAGESAPGENDGDSFKIGENTTQILTDVFGSIPDLGFDLQSTLTKYMARWFRGTTDLEVIKAVCELEGLHWWEDYVNNIIKISTEADFVDSLVDLTSGGNAKWEYDDTCNYYYRIEVFGSAALGIFAYKEDLAITSKMVWQIIDESILTVPDAQEVADTQFAELSVKRPSIKIELKGVNSALTVGKTVHLTMARPTIGQVLYPIRMLNRTRFGKTEILTTMWCGLGKSPLEEEIADRINTNAYMAHKAHTDRLISTPLGEGAIITAGAIGGLTNYIENIIIAELVGGQSIDNAIDALLHPEAHLHDGDILQTDGITSNGGFDFAIGSANKIELIPDGDVDNYVQFKTAADIPSIEFIGGNPGRIANVRDPLNNQEAATKKYVDDNEYTDADAQAVSCTEAEAKAASVNSNAYDEGDWNGVTKAPDQNAVRDKIVGMDALIAANTTVAEVLTEINHQIEAAHVINNAIDALIAATDHVNAAGAKAASVNNNAYDAGDWNGVTKAPDQNAVRDKIVGMDGLIAANTTEAEVNALIAAAGGGTQSIELALYHSSAARGPGYIWLQAVGDGVVCNFTIDSTMDATQDMRVVLEFRRGDAGADTVAAQLYVDASATDGSEQWNWDIENATAFNFPATAQWKHETYSYTIANAGIVDGDVIHLMFNCNEAAKDIRVENVMVFYEGA